MLTDRDITDDDLASFSPADLECGAALAALRRSHREFKEAFGYEPIVRVVVDDDASTPLAEKLERILNRLARE